MMIHQKVKYIFFPRRSGVGADEVTHRHGELISAFSSKDTSSLFNLNPAASLGFRK